MRRIESRACLSSFRCDCQTADDLQARVIARIVWPAPGAPVFPEALDHIEGDGAPRSATSWFPMPPRGSTGAHLSRQRETRAPGGAPPSQACAGWALSWAAISLPGTVASGARTDGFRSLRDRGPPCSCGLWPAFVRPTSSPLLWAAPLSWGGRQTQGVPDTRVRTVARAPHRARACSPARAPVPCLAAPPTAPLQERLMKRPSMSRTEMGL